MTIVDDPSYELSTPHKSEPRILYHDQVALRAKVVGRDVTWLATNIILVTMNVATGGSDPVVANFSLEQVRKRNETLKSQNLDVPTPSLDRSLSLSLGRATQIQITIPPYRGYFPTNLGR